MEAPARQQSFRQQSFRQGSFKQKKITKQLTGKKGDTPLHSAIRVGNLKEALRILSNYQKQEELKDLLIKQNQSGETALYVAAEIGSVDIVKELINHLDVGSASLRATNGFDAFHIAAKRGDLDVLKVLTEALPELLMTTDLSNTTALHTAAAQGHFDVVDFLLEKKSSLANIARNNGKTALHSAARNGHLNVVESLMNKEPGIALRTDKKGQTALHMAVKGHNAELVDVMVKPDCSVLNMVDSKCNTALHIATRKGRAEIVLKLLSYKATDKEAINKSRETALDTAEKIGNFHIACILREHGVRSAKVLELPTNVAPARELKQTVSDIKHEVHDQIEHTLQTRRRMQHITRRLNKMHREGINNAINSSTVVAILIASIAFAAIFSVPGQYVDDPNNIPPGLSLGEANIAPRNEFMVFFIFDSVALFISLAVVVVQTSVIIIEKKAKRQMVAVINKLMWLACVCVSVAFLALSYIVVGEKQRWLAISVTVIGTIIMSSTLGVMCYWVIQHRIEASKLKSNRRSSLSTTNRSRYSRSMSIMSDSDLEKDFRRLYAV